MNVRLRKTFGWLSALVLDDGFLVNHCTAELDLVTISHDTGQQNIAYERMKFWFEEVLDGAIFIHENHPDLKRWQATGARIITMPHDPVDQIIGIMLCSKLNAIMEDRLQVTDVEIWSRAGDGMSYLHNWQENLGPLSREDWWTDPRPVWGPRGRESGKIVNLDRSGDWAAHDLDWEPSDPKVSNTVVFGKFDNDADQ